MSDWNPALYTRFEDERTRPAAELLARVPALPQAGGLVVDLGCGPGNSTELLVQRFPQARVRGMDNSPAMLASARERLPGVDFEQGDIGDWSPAEPAALLYANASLQWITGHERLMPRLLSLVAPGGALAVQMPDNLDQPSHVSMRETAAEPRFAEHIGDASQVRARILPAEAYCDLLAKQADVDVWRTTYYHPMDDAAAIVQWLRATGLKPFVEALPEPLRADFIGAYQARIEQIYPVRADGRRLLAFPRLFLVAQRRRT